MENERALVVDIAPVGLAGGFCSRCNRRGVANVTTAALHRRYVSVLAPSLLDVEGVHKALEAFVDPHVAPVRVRDQVRPPFVAELVEQEPIEPVLREAVAVAVSDRSRVLHSEMRRFDDSRLNASKGKRA